MAYDDGPMPLSSWTGIGTYEITGAIGAGGVGEVVSLESSTEAPHAVRD